MYVLLLLWFMWSFLFSLISYHDLLAILSRGYVCYRFIFLYVLFIVGVDVRPLTPGLGPPQIIPTRKHNEKETRQRDTTAKEKDQIEDTSTEVPGLKTVYQML